MLLRIVSCEVEEPNYHVNYTWFIELTKFAYITYIYITFHSNFELYMNYHFSYISVA